MSKGQTSKIQTFVSDVAGKTRKGTSESSSSHSNKHHHYYVFAADHQVYGPATLSVLQEWCAQGLVSTETWIFDEESNVWKAGRQIKGLRGFIPLPANFRETAAPVISRDQLRRLRIFSDLDDHQLEEFMPYLHEVKIPALRTVVQKGEHGSFLMILFTGEATISTMVDGTRKSLGTLTVGDFFGETTLIEVAPRPYDVRTNEDCHFLVVRHSDFQSILQKQPDVASKFLTAIVRHVSYQNLNTSTRFAKARAMQKGSMGQTGKIEVPPMFIQKN